jgi:hypothetical protein
MTTPAPESPDPVDLVHEAATEGFSGLWRIVGQIVASTGVLLALLVYFGWVRTDVFFGVFGISTSTLGFSVQDYALRSVQATVQPLVVVLLVLVLIRPAHLVVLRAARSESRAAAFVAPAVIAIGAVALVVGLAGFTGIVVFDVEWPLVPMSLGLGTLVVAYGITVRRMRAASAAGAPDAALPPFAVLQRVALAAVVVLTLFWSAAVFAQLSGIDEAERVASRPTGLPGVVVFTPHRLHVAGSGVTETILAAEPEPAYRYRYDGLHLLIRSDGRYFLLPAGWRPGVRAIVLSEDPGYRMEFFRR